jgi:2-polyprenyl-6-methoxyphenol hydroxylase-like FAD-dependent oxidoreductase
MADVVVTGGGMCGLLTGMLLADDGHEVTVLERDPMEPPGDPEDVWATWERRGVNQFRLGHFLLPRFRAVAEAELPDVVTALDARGALRFNVIHALPEFVTGGHRDGDERFEAVTARRPVLEAAAAAAARARPRLTVRRGVAVDALVTGPEHLPGVPHVVGVRTDTGEEIRADLVVDATGRRSPLPRWLADAGAEPPYEELEDCGFVYYGRHFRSPDGSLPAAFGPPLNPFGSISALTLPCDHGTWTVVLVASATDTAMRRLKDAETWLSVVRELPTVAHWIDGEPIDEIAVMAKIEDRYRRYVVDGAPVATGVVPVADSWACTNPSVGESAWGSCRPSCSGTRSSRWVSTTRRPSRSRMTRRPPSSSSRSTATRSRGTGTGWRRWPPPSRAAPRWSPTTSGRGRSSPSPPRPQPIPSSSARPRRWARS